MAQKHNFYLNYCTYTLTVPRFESSVHKYTVYIYKNFATPISKGKSLIKLILLYRPLLLTIVPVDTSKLIRDIRRAISNKWLINN